MSGAPVVKPTSLSVFLTAPSPAAAVALAVDDHRAGKIVDFDFVDQLLKAQRQVEAYQKLVAALRGEYPGRPSYDEWSQERFEDGFVHTREVYHAEMRHELLLELGERKS